MTEEKGVGSDRGSERGPVSRCMGVDQRLSDSGWTSLRYGFRRYAYNKKSRSSSKSPKSRDTDPSSHHSDLSRSETELAEGRDLWGTGLG